MMRCDAILVLLLTKSIVTNSFIPHPPFSKQTKQIFSSEWKSDFEDFLPDFDESGKEEDLLVSKFFPSTASSDDLSACRARQLSLGADLVLTDYAGSMGFDMVTDWEYYYADEDDDDIRRVVQPNPLDPSQPKRTRESSGSVVRIFRGEFAGRLGSSVRARGLDRRVLIKEFSGQMALDLARAELVSIGKLQSDLIATIDGAKDGDWVKAATSRTSTTLGQRQDDSNVCRLIERLNKAPYMGILGEVNLAELEDDLDPNEFYRAMGVKPPSSDAIWIVYEYAGLRSLQIYAKPAEVRRSLLPPQRGLFGPTPPAAIPRWNDRARYVRAIIRQCLEGVATLHESGIAHHSIGQSSLLISSPNMDKAEASSPYTVNPSMLAMKLADFGFSGRMDLSTYDSDFIRRAKTFGLFFQERAEPTEECVRYAMAEDLHALGFVTVGLLLTSLAEVSDPKQNIPATDEDTLQRLMTDIFGKDMEQFRDYVEAEEDIWIDVVEMLDKSDGWSLLDALCFARERVVEDKFVTARELLKHQFFR